MSSLRWTPLEPTTLWLTWSPACRKSTRTTPSPLCPMRKALLCCTIWRSWWEGQVIHGRTWTHHTLSEPQTLYLLVCLLQRCSWVLWSRTSSCLPTAALLQTSGRTTCSPTLKTRWETPGCSGESKLQQKLWRAHSDIISVQTSVFDGNSADFQGLYQAWGFSAL